MTARHAAVVEILRVALRAADRLEPEQRDEVYRALRAELRERRSACGASRSAALALVPPLSREAADLPRDGR